MRSFFRHSRWDVLLLAVTLFQLGLNAGLAVTWESRSWSQNLGWVAIVLFIFWYNALIATHNFVHTPWFTSKLFNRIYSIINSANLGFPVMHYRYIHFNHHQYGNDRPDEKGLTQDWSSTYAYGKQGLSEPVIAYCGLAILRDDLAASFRQAAKQNEIVQISLESAACGVVAIAYLLISWQFFIGCFLPVFYCGWFLTYLSNYYEHFGANPENQYADSASYYDRWFNLLFCNEGYHQEHHLRPNVHWTRRSHLYQEFRQKLDGVDRVILQFPHVLGFLHHRGQTESSK
jgi:fatty acid desaturase